jgi:hypothetical protein
MIKLIAEKVLSKDSSTWNFHKIPKVFLKNFDRRKRVAGGPSPRPYFGRGKTRITKKG